MTNAFICDAARTAIGRFGGALAGVRADDLGAIPMRALIERNPTLDPAAIDDVYLGCANQAGEDNRDVARMSALLAGLPVSVPGVTLNRLCASGLDAVGTAARSIQAGQIDLALAGGVESMTRAPFVLGKAELPYQRSAALEDTTIGWRFINPLLQAQYGVDSMPETAENVASACGVSREDQDSFALRSQERAAAAARSGWLAAEIVPVRTRDRRGNETVVDIDEHPRPETTLVTLAKLKAAFRTGGSVTAGNASGVNDGAAGLILASDAAVRDHGLTPRARVVGMATAGVEPRLMGLGPIPAVEKLLTRLKLSLSDFDYIEINEAFAAQVIACARTLGIDPSDPRLNPNGGAIALGHPLGMSGARLALTATHALANAGRGRALVTLCVGVGQGVALALEAT